tara:strand:+ start:293 stop:832 length:540 start_codon:yes stop_codon:yes gene_type:complete
VHKVLDVLTHPVIFLINSAIFGLTTKLSDLFNEHGLKWFKGADILFGVLWGIFGALTIIGNPLAGSLYLAILFHWILRDKIDYVNHGIAATIIFLSVLLTPNLVIEPTFFLTILVIYSTFGILRDKKKIAGNWFIKSNAHGFFAIIIFMFVNQAMGLVLASYLANTIFYQLAKKLEPQP